MPQITHRGEFWRECDRCGFMYPKSWLRREEGTGLLVCTKVVNCWREDPDLRNAQRQALLDDDSEDFGLIFPGGL